MEFDYPPDFPEQIPLHAVIKFVAHGTVKWEIIKDLYLSGPEREDVEEQAEAHVFELLRSGHLRGSGRYSKTTTKRKVSRWQIQRYKQHSKKRTYIQKKFWREFQMTQYYSTFRDPNGEYTDVYFLIEDIRKYLVHRCRQVVHPTAPQSSATLRSSLNHPSASVH